MRNFLRDLRRISTRAKRIEDGLTLVPDMTGGNVLPRVAKFNVVAKDGGISRTVGFNLTIDEAETVKRCAEKRMRKTRGFDDIGPTMFEITIVEIKRIQKD